VLSVAARSDSAREVRLGIKKVHVQDQEGAVLRARPVFFKTKENGKLEMNQIQAQANRYV
jgi:hypothetical protein